MISSPPIGRKNDSDDLHKNGKATLGDIAARVGVTGATVSYVLNGRKKVSEPTREAVLKAMDELGYHHNLLARGLATGRSRMLGVLAYRVQSRFAALQLSGIEEEAQQCGYHVVIASHQHEPDRAFEALKSMSARRLDGVLSISSTANLYPGVAALLPQLKLPYVYVFHAPARARETDCVLIDQAQGAYLATRHLLEQGRHHIAFLGGPQSRVVSTQRLQGFRRAHRELDVEVDEKLVLHGEDFFVPDGLKLADQILGARRNYKGGKLAFDGAFCVSDLLAAGLMRVLHRAGWHVPDDVAVMGFDDHPLCDAVEPPLSSVQVPVTEAGRIAVRRLIARIETPDKWQPEITRLPCRLVLRESA